MEDANGKPMLLDLIEQHYQLVYRYSYRLSGSATDAEDLCQQTFLTAQKKLAQLRDLETAGGWLCAISRNHYLKRLRQEKKAPTTSLEHAPEPTIQVTPAGEFDSEDLQRVLNQLPEEYRTPLILFYFEEFSYKEIAEQLDVPLGTVMSRLSRGKTMLRKQLQPEDSAVESAPNG